MLVLILIWLIYKEDRCRDGYSSKKQLLSQPGTHQLQLRQNVGSGGDGSALALLRGPIVVANVAIEGAMVGTGGATGTGAVVTTALLLAVLGGSAVARCTPAASSSCLSCKKL
jgi:hypothetical protein